MTKPKNKPSAKVKKVRQNETKKRRYPQGPVPIAPLLGHDTPAFVYPF